ncbi:MAG: hypothetical protein K2G21_04400 [Muribaculaceae bacterium]|nr:hypothetical protein [Muribaculaceae bacterium]
MIDTASITVLAALDVDSYPVGLDVSPDGATVIVTSQGRPGATGSGNSVSIYRTTFRGGASR